MLPARGSSPTQIAGRLFLAPETVRNHITTMLGKLGVTSRDEAVALAQAAGMELAPPW